jgi:hypothetical protein
MGPVFARGKSAERRKVEFLLPITEQLPLTIRKKSVFELRQKRVGKMRALKIRWRILRKKLFRNFEMQHANFAPF